MRHAAHPPARWLLGSVLASAALAIGCTTLPRGPQNCVGPGKAALRQLDHSLELDDWRATEVLGLRVYTDADPLLAARVVRKLESFIRLSSRLISGREYAASRPVSVFLFEKAAQYQLFGTCQTAGHAVQGDESFALGLILENDDVGVLQHEIVHLLLFERSDRSYPPWFHEGLASFLGATVIRSGMASIGALPTQRSQTISLTEPLTVERLLSSGSAFQPTFAETVRYYADSWAFVHYGLMSKAMGKAARATSLLELADATGRGVAWREALSGAFPIALADVEAEYRRHRGLLAGSAAPPQAHVSLPKRDDELLFTPLDRGQVSRPLGSYALDLGVQRAGLAAALFDRALAANPSDPVALRGGARAAARLEDFVEADSLWARLPKAERETIAGWLARGELAHRRYAALTEADRSREGAPFLDEARHAYRTVLAASPRQFSALVGLADTFVMAPDEADVTEGIRALEAAAEMAPTAAPVHLSLGRLYLRAGQLDLARRQFEFVLAAHPGTEYAREAEGLIERS